MDYNPVLFCFVCLVFALFCFLLEICIAIVGLVQWALNFKVHML